jgi:23S rRNA (pseudouridine1915-N3)-methyltransferase
MIYKIACVGKIKEKYYTELIEKSVKSVKGRDSLVIAEVPDEKIPQKAGDKINAAILDKEGEALIKVIDKEAYVIALCIEGKKTDTDELRRLISRAEDRGYRKITFVIGGSLGLSPKVTELADYKLSISDMTFPHQLMRAVIAETISNL